MDLLADSVWRGRVFTGRWVVPVGGDAPVREPATGAELGRHGVAGPADVAASAAEAAGAQPGWAALPHTERAAVLRRAGDLFRDHGPRIGRWLVREGGSVPAKAEHELFVAAEACYEAAALPSHPCGDVLPSTLPRLSVVRRVPAGVVGVIAPFNFPLVLAIRAVAPALALGNAVVLKPDPRTAVGGGVSIARVFEEAGLPAGVLHMLPGGAETGDALVTDPYVRVVSFTGSTAAGRSVAERAGRLLKRVHLELGGNSALIVLDDADLDAAVSAAVWGSYFHQGQICMATGRHLVQAGVYDEYVERLAAKAEALAVGDPNTADVALGPVIDERQRDRIHGLVGASVAAGAGLAAGGRYEGLFYRPTVLARASGTPAFTREVFGPVAPVARFDSPDEAVAAAVDTEYGLSLGVVTRDVMRGLEMVERIPTGMAHVNDQTVVSEPHAPFGGMAASGTGVRFGGAAAAVEAFTETRWVTVRGDVAAYPL